VGVPAALVLLVFLSSIAHAGIGSVFFDRGTELSVTLFKPGVWINQHDMIDDEVYHLFTVPKNEYLGFYISSVGSGTLAFQSAYGYGRQDLRFYSDGPVSSRGPWTLKTGWMYLNLGAVWNLRSGRLEAAPSLGCGTTFQFADLSHPQLGGLYSRSLGSLMAHVELPVRLRLYGHFGLSVAYHRMFPLTDMTYNVGFVNTVKLRVHLENPYEVRFGIFRFR
jgi:hypothetical protein